MKASDELYIDHEVRTRVIENAIVDMNNKTNAVVIDIRSQINIAVQEFNNKINILIGVLLGSVILPIILHTFKLM